MYCNLMIWGCFFKMANTHVMFFVKMDFSLLCLLFSLFFFFILLIALYILMNMFYFLYVLHDGNNENFHLSFHWLLNRQETCFIDASLLFWLYESFKNVKDSSESIFCILLQVIYMYISYMGLLDGNEISCVFLASVVYTLFICDWFLE